MTKTKMTLKFTGHRDFSDNKMYQNEEGLYFSKDDFNDIIYIGKEPDSDPWGSVKTLDKYKDVEFITVGDENLPTEAERFDYMMLSMMKGQCEYYLGYGNRNKHHLACDTEQEHIDAMKRRWNKFSDDKKPEWLTWNQILEYEKLMTEGV